MSADNGIYIAQFPDGYRVVHTSAIENIDFYPEGSIERKQMLKDYFGESEVFVNYRYAYEHALILNEKLNEMDVFLEYGILSLGEYESFE